MEQIMRKQILTGIAAVGLISLGACQSEEAERVENQAEAEAEVLEDMADRAPTDAQEDALDAQADAVEDAGEARANQIDSEAGVVTPGTVTNQPGTVPNQ
ncbi:hypothetical protein GCM10010833_31520 [Blastomonas aquatica]|uniref:Secreted protein n=2 Tax=Blastomonas aquatica TaxID=1510276 RepID=A0ABQ1JRU9_9SPHN|nr:hypothetical protein GCM10010833_31520 [Blastomonas aquatica]